MSAIRTAGLVAALVLVQPGASGCQSCTLIFAPSTLTVAFEDGDLEPGRYEVELTDIPFGGYATQMCVIDLPFEQDIGPWCTMGAGLGFDEAGLRSLDVISQVPEQFTVTVLRDGDLVAEQDFEPAYAESQPNGKGCGTRLTATVSMGLDSGLP